jgi:hypothetical protein
MSTGAAATTPQFSLSIVDANTRHELRRGNLSLIQQTLDGLSGREGTGIPPAPITPAPVAEKKVRKPMSAARKKALSVTMKRKAEEAKAAAAAAGETPKAKGRAKTAPAAA